MDGLTSVTEMDRGGVYEMDGPINAIEMDKIV